MLPQRAIVNPSSATNMPVLDEVECESMPLTRAKVRQSSKPLDIHARSVTSMLPPSTTGRPRLSPNDARTTAGISVFIQTFKSDF